MTKLAGKKKASPKFVAFMDRYGIVLYIWFLLVLVRWFQNKTALLNGDLASNDDHMRMVQIRDWLNG